MFHVITQALSGTCVVNFNWIIINNNNNNNNKIMKKKLPKKNSFLIVYKWKVLNEIEFRFKQCMYWSECL